MMLYPLNQDLLKTQVAEYRDDIDVVVHQTISSTNDWCLAQCKSGKRLPFACFAEEQTSGKGRRGKSWVMAPGASIALSLSWSFCIAQQEVRLLPLSAAIAVAKTLSRYKLGHIGIKWPNDVYIRDKKIAGILIESQSFQLSNGDNDAETALVIGVGLNFSMSDTISVLVHGSDELALGITDITRELRSQGVAIDVQRQEIASALLQNLVVACEHFENNSTMVLDEFRTHYDYCEDKAVEIVQENQETLTGVAKGVNDDAELLVMIDGEMRVFNSADVSVKTEI